MRSMKSRLLSSTFIPVLVGAGVVVGGAVAPSAPGYAAGPSVERMNPLPVARPKPATIQLAQCKPCNPCNPCAAKNGCNPCNPCAAGAAASSKCFVPRLRTAGRGPESHGLSGGDAHGDRHGARQADWTASGHHFPIGGRLGPRDTPPPTIRPMDRPRARRHITIM